MILKYPHSPESALLEDVDPLRMGPGRRLLGH